MSKLKTTVIKRSDKQDREHKVLIGLVDYYLKTNKPVGSNSLKEAGFDDLSSATIRNYFVRLEEEGYLVQQHVSGGRIPTYKAYQAYATEYIDSSEIPDHAEQQFHTIRMAETREIASYLQQVAETLSTLTQSAVFLSAPRFDNDYIIGLKLVPIDHNRCLCVILTDFGVIRTEVLPVESKLSAFTAKRVESYFHWRITGQDRPENFDSEEERLAQKLYNELMIRYIVGYSNFIDSELYKTGLSKLLSYPEFHDPIALSSSLALFENTQKMQMLVTECCKFNQLKFWIGNDLNAYASSIPDCAVIAIPYYIGKNTAGAVGVLGPMRMPYRSIFGLLKGFASSVSEALTRNLYKYKITFRQPDSRHVPELPKEDYRQLLLEDRSV